MEAPHRFLVAATNLLLRRLPPGTRPVLIVGHGRSGTTWIGHVVGLAPGALYYSEPARPGLRLGWPDPDKWLAYFRPDHPDPYFERWLSQAFDGLIDPAMTWKRRDLITRLRPGRRVVIKEVASLMVLDWLCERFDPLVVFVIRHPCAVALSERDWQVDGVEELRLLLENAHLITDHLDPYLDHLRGVSTPYGALGAVWGIRNHVALAQLRSREHVVLRYETVASDPPATFAMLYERLGLVFESNIAREISFLNAVHDKGSRAIRKRPEETVDRWRRTMSQEDIDLVLRAVEPFGIEQQLSSHPLIGP